MRQVYLLGLSVVLSLSVGCAPTGFKPIELGGGNTKTDTPDDPPVTKMCTVDATDFELDARVLSFEMTDRTNISLGFNFLSGFFRAIGLNANIKSGLLDMRMDLYHSMLPGNEDRIASVLDKAKFSDSSFGFNLDAVQLGLDLSYYHRTPLARLSKAALQNTFKTLMAAAKEDQLLAKAWNTRVTQVRELPLQGDVIEKRLTLAAGSNAGFVEGDLVDIYNVYDHWYGTPCESRYQKFEKISVTPMKGKIITVTGNEAIVAVIGGYEEIKVGAIAELTPDKKGKVKSMRRSIRLGELPPAMISIQGVGNIDITRFMYEQIDPVLREKGYYLVQ